MAASFTAEVVARHDELWEQGPRGRRWGGRDGWPKKKWPGVVGFLETTSRADEKNGQVFNHFQNCFFGL